MNTKYIISFLFTFALALGLCFTSACNNYSSGNVDANLDGDVDGNQNGDQNGDESGDKGGDESGADMAHPLCTAVGGTCTEERWILCPVGTEPIDPDPHQDCGSNLGSGGWCCVDAPPSTCSDSSYANCIAGTKCEGCWASVQDLSCEAGRVCCTDICD